MAKDMNIAIIAIAVGVFLSGCSTISVNGFDVKRHFKDTDTRQKLAVIAGAATSIGTHVAGHMIAAEAMGLTYDFDGFFERYDGHLTNEEIQWIGRSGPLFQVAIGLLVEALFDGTAFADGYHIASLIEIGTYPLIHKNYMPENGTPFLGDYQALKAGGANAELEWIGYTVLALYPVLRSSQ